MASDSEIINKFWKGGDIYDLFWNVDIDYKIIIKSS